MRSTGDRIECARLLVCRQRRVPRRSRKMCGRREALALPKAFRAALDAARYFSGPRTDAPPNARAIYLHNSLGAPRSAPAQHALGGNTSSSIHPRIAIDAFFKFPTAALVVSASPPGSAPERSTNARLRLKTPADSACEFASNSRRQRSSSAPSRSRLSIAAPRALQGVIVRTASTPPLLPPGNKPRHFRCCNPPSLRRGDIEVLLTPNS